MYKKINAFIPYVWSVKRALGSSAYYERLILLTRYKSSRNKSIRAAIKSRSMSDVQSRIVTLERYLAIILVEIARCLLTFGNNRSSIIVLITRTRLIAAESDGCSCSQRFVQLNNEINETTQSVRFPEFSQTFD